jgi:hypothetical protein
LDAAYCRRVVGALEVNYLGIDVGRIEELNIGIIVDELAVTKRSEELESVIRVSGGFPGLLPTRPSPLSA